MRKNKKESSMSQNQVITSIRYGDGVERMQVPHPPAAKPEYADKHGIDSRSGSIAKLEVHQIRLKPLSKCRLAAEYAFLISSD